MAINIFCLECKTSNALTAKTCSKCGAVFTRDKKYRVCVSVKGQRITRLCDNLTIARETETAIKTDMLRDEFDITAHRKKKVVTLSDIWDQHYLAWAKSNKAKSWVTDDFFYRKHILPCFGSKTLDSISSFDLERLKAEMKQATTPQGKKGYADATVRHVLVLLGSIYNRAAEWKLYAGENPCKAVKKPKLNNQVTEFLSDDEMKRLLDTLDAWSCKESADFVRIALFVGLRKSEILKLKWSDLDLDRKTITLRDPKNGFDTVLPLNDEAVNVFRGIERTSEYVLPGPGGELKRSFRKPWYAIRQAAGLPESYRLHGLRHNFASHLVSNGVDLFTVSKLLSHRDLQTSTRYAHLSDGALRQATALGGKVLAKTQSEREADVIPLREKR